MLLIYCFLATLYTKEILTEFFILRKVKQKQLAKFIRKLFIFRVFKNILLFILLIEPNDFQYIISLLVFNEFIISKLYHKFLERWEDELR